MHGTTLLLAALLVAAPAAGAQELPDGFVRAERCPGDGIQPRVVQEGPVVHLVYAKGALERADLFYVRTEDGGASYSEPVRVNSAEGGLDARPSRGAALALGAEGRVHVAWVGSEAYGAEEGPPLRYARFDPTSGAFEPERELAPVHGGLSSAPALASDRAGRLYVFWQATGPGADTKRVEKQVEEHGAWRRVWMTASEDDGETFAAEVAIDPDDTGAEAEYGLSADIDPHSGAVIVLYRIHMLGRVRDTRFLWSEDDGATFDARAAGNLTLSRPAAGRGYLSRGPARPMVAWEDDGKVFWAPLDRRKRRITLPIAPRPGDVYRRYPVVAMNQFQAAVVVWVEGPNRRKPVERLGWQAFRMDTRQSLDLDRVGGVPPDTCPAIFVRPDDGFTILY